MKEGMSAVVVISDYFRLICKRQLIGYNLIKKKIGGFTAHARIPDCPLSSKPPLDKPASSGLVSNIIFSFFNFKQGKETTAWLAASSADDGIDWKWMGNGKDGKDLLMNFSYWADNEPKRKGTVFVLFISPPPFQ